MLAWILGHWQFFLSNIQCISTIKPLGMHLYYKYNGSIFSVISNHWQCFFKQNSMNLHRKINSNELGGHLKFSPWSPNTKKCSIGKLDAAKRDEILAIFKIKLAR